MHWEISSARKAAQVGACDALSDPEPGFILVVIREKPTEEQSSSSFTITTEAAQYQVHEENDAPYKPWT